MNEVSLLKEEYDLALGLEAGLLILVQSLKSMSLLKTFISIGVVLLLLLPSYVEHSGILEVSMEPTLDIFLDKFLGERLMMVLERVEFFVIAG